MVPLSALSRRALIAAAAVAALAPNAEARTRSKPPLAVVAGTLVDALPSADGTTFRWVFRGSAAHLTTTEHVTDHLEVTIVVPEAATPDQARKKIVATVRTSGADLVSFLLGLPIPADRVAVTLL